MAEADQATLTAERLAPDALKDTTSRSLYSAGDHYESYVAKTFESKAISPSENFEGKSKSNTGSVFRFHNVDYTSTPWDIDGTPVTGHAFDKRAYFMERYVNSVVYSDDLKRVFQSDVINTGLNEARRMAAGRAADENVFKTVLNAVPTIQLNLAAAKETYYVGERAGYDGTDFLSQLKLVPAATDVPFARTQFIWSLSNGTVTDNSVTPATTRDYDDYSDKTLFYKIRSFFKNRKDSNGIIHSYPEEKVYVQLTPYFFSLLANGNADFLYEFNKNYNPNLGYYDYGGVRMIMTPEDMSAGYFFTHDAAATNLELNMITDLFSNGNLNTIAARRFNPYNLRASGSTPNVPDHPTFDSKVLFTNSDIGFNESMTNLKLNTATGLSGIGGFTEYSDQHDGKNFILAWTPRAVQRRYYISKEGSGEFEIRATIDGLLNTDVVHIGSYVQDENFLMLLHIREGDNRTIA